MHSRYSGPHGVISNLITDPFSQTDHFLEYDLGLIETHSKHMYQFHITSRLFMLIRLICDLQSYSLSCHRTSHPTVEPMYHAFFTHDFTGLFSANLRASLRIQKFRYKIFSRDSVRRPRPSQYNSDPLLFLSSKVHFCN